jgi:hypothetical protein
MLLLLVVALLGAAAAQTPITYGSVYYENGQYEVCSSSPAPRDELATILWPIARHMAIAHTYDGLHQ